MKKLLHIFVLVNKIIIVKDTHNYEIYQIYNKFTLNAQVDIPYCILVLVIWQINQANFTFFYQIEPMNKIYYKLTFINSNYYGKSLKLAEVIWKKNGKCSMMYSDYTYTSSQKDVAK